MLVMVPLVELWSLSKPFYVRFATLGVSPSQNTMTPNTETPCLDQRSLARSNCEDE